MWAFLGPHAPPSSHRVWASSARTSSYHRGLSPAVARSPPSPPTIVVEACLPLASHRQPLSSHRQRSADRLHPSKHYHPMTVYVLAQPFLVQVVRRNTHISIFGPVANHADSNTMGPKRHIECCAAGLASLRTQGARRGPPRTLRAASLHGASHAGH